MYKSVQVKTAAKFGDLQMLEAVLISGGAGLLREAGDQSELAPLHLACAGNHASVVSFLLSEKVECDPNLSRGNSFTPLHAAAMKGNVKICELLLAAGANPNLQTAPPEVHAAS